ncbi:DUF2591 domain-containing protein [Burkholderia cenocepacia]|nr:DUF2591 domain-containing protein [Burkholderia cenocepacia]RQU21049.1 DUF2591 domain-containing protein [Burkholderia cenocepacia]
MKASQLTGTQLDYWVAKAENYKIDATFEKGLNPNLYVFVDGELIDFAPSVNWAQGGPIVERAHIGFAQMFFRGPPGGWTAFVNARGTVVGLDGDFDADGPTQLIAAMRAYVASKFGDEVPDAPA